jgi:hypothetical protein
VPVKAEKGRAMAIQSDVTEIVKPAESPYYIAQRLEMLIDVFEH